MKMKVTKEWLLKNAERDQDLKVTAGFLSDDKLNAVYGSKKENNKKKKSGISKAGLPKISTSK